ncbi:MAG: hypothetical protein ACYC0B_02225 [Gemmatimonadaceae bacterium]
MARTRRGEPQAAPELGDSGAPAVLHIDLAALAAEIGSAPLEVPTPLTAHEELMLSEARRSARGDQDQPPRREMIAVALKALDREIAWRDQAEQRALERMRTIARLREQRLKYMAIVFELAGWIASRAGISPGLHTVLAYVRSFRSGLLPEAPAGSLAERIRAEVARG